MEIFEITIDDEVYISMDTDYFGIINTIVLESNMYGKVKFLDKDFFYIMSEEGPIAVSGIEMAKILLHHKEN